MQLLLLASLRPTLVWLFPLSTGFSFFLESTNVKLESSCLYFKTCWLWNKYSLVQLVYIHFDVPIKKNQYLKCTIPYSWFKSKSKICYTICLQGRLLDTMSYVDPLPPFRTNQWKVIVLLFIDALSVCRIPALTQYMSSKRMLLHKVMHIRVTCILLLLYLI